MSDADFLKKLGISEWTELPKVEEELNRKKEHTMQLSNIDDLNNNDLNYFDQNPSEDPFIEVDGLNAEDDNLVEDDFYTATIEDLQSAIQDYLTFSTPADLIKLVAKYV